LGAAGCRWFSTRPARLDAAISKKEKQGEQDCSHNGYDRDSLSAARRTFLVSYRSVSHDEPSYFGLQFFLMAQRYTKKGVG
jgi:hypothetical protein